MFTLDRERSRVSVRKASIEILARPQRRHVLFGADGIRNSLFFNSRCKGPRSESISAFLTWLIDKCLFSFLWTRAIFTKISVSDFASWNNKFSTLISSSRISQMAWEGLKNEIWIFNLPWPWWMCFLEREIYHQDTRLKVVASADPAAGHDFCYALKNITFHNFFFDRESSQLSLI